MGKQTPILRMLLLMASTLRFLTSGPPINQPRAQEQRINSTIATIPLVPINLIAGVLYLPAITAAMMKITMDTLPNHKPRLGACWEISLCKPRRHDNEEKQHQDQPSDRQLSRSLAVKEPKN